MYKKKVLSFVNYAQSEDGSLYQHFTEMFHVRIQLDRTATILKNILIIIGNTFITFLVLRKMFWLYLMK
jgi:hypothetical protein